MLNTLNLNGNLIDSEGVNTLVKLKNLENLNIGNNNIKDKGMLIIAKGMYKLRKLDVGIL